MSLVLGSAGLLDGQRWLPKERTSKKVITFIWAWVGTEQTVTFRKRVGQGHGHSAWGTQAAARIEVLAQGWVRVGTACSRLYIRSWMLLFVLSLKTFR